MTTATALYDTARKYLLDGTIDLDTDTIKIALLDSGYNPQPSAAAYATTTVYAVGTIIVDGGRFHEAVVGGVSSGAHPTFPTVPGTTLVDNTVTWFCWGYAPPSSHTVFADVSAHEIVGTGYTAGGNTLTGITITQTLRSVKVSAANPTWPGAFFSPHYAVIYKSGTANGHVDPLVAYVLLDDANLDILIPVPALFSLTWSSTGIFTFN